ncbi:MAG: hypothetical protein QXL45_02070 [Candidatus Bathyarchaeia archaeon]
MILGVTEEYNRYRPPKVNARLTSMADDTLQIEFAGSFCYTRGSYDYFEDIEFCLKRRV